MVFNRLGWVAPIALACIFDFRYLVLTVSHRTTQMRHTGHRRRCTGVTGAIGVAVVCGSNMAPRVARGVSGMCWLRLVRVVWLERPLEACAWACDGP